MVNLTQVTTFCGEPCCTIEEATLAIKNLEDQLEYREQFIEAAFAAHPNLDIDIEYTNARA